MVATEVSRMTRSFSTSAAREERTFVRLPLRERFVGKPRSLIRTTGTVLVTRSTSSQFVASASSAQVYRAIVNRDKSSRSNVLRSKRPNS
ncbi:hypothetical protein BS329_27660 [Amycolatopsis coloradensis]|uniref:Uncharacterized protein n=1 Tax=Amycolatopsis coloradensis TaxID=76021 RepID=A0A1R0KM15_9PSEU|nr:hypothetical protein BS329_27660 [Amycolatopsis coloradensis]